MIEKFTLILCFWLASSCISFALYPRYIDLLKHFKAGKQIREESMTWEKSSIFSALHAHKAGTPTMWWGLFLIVVALMVLLSLAVQNTWRANNSLLDRWETYIILFALLSMWLLWLIDDIFNIKGKTKIKWLTAKMKLIRMFLFSWFISRWFYEKLGIDYINLRPFAWETILGILMPIFTFFFTISVVNAINITDWLDGLVGWLVLMVLWVLWVITFTSHWYLATTIIAIIIWCLIAFLWFNINPARIFMWDSGSLGLWGLIATLVYLINIKIGIFVPFMIVFAIFWIEFSSSLLQILWKKVWKKKLFTIAPYHHALEKKWLAEHTIVMRFWLIQSILATIGLTMFFYQIQSLM